jgi:hypothetical protein
LAEQLRVIVGLSNIATASTMKITKVIYLHTTDPLLYKLVISFMMTIQRSIITFLQCMSDVFVLSICSVRNCAVLSKRKEIIIKSKHLEEEQHQIISL